MTEVLCSIVALYVLGFCFVLIQRFEGIMNRLLFCATVSLLLVLGLYESVCL